jgi:hypothetical protein
MLPRKRSQQSSRDSVAVGAEADPKRIKSALSLMSLPNDAVDLILGHLGELSLLCIGTASRVLRVASADVLRRRMALLGVERLSGFVFHGPSAAPPMSVAAQWRAVARGIVLPREYDVLHATPDTLERMVESHRYGDVRVMLRPGRYGDVTLKRNALSSDARLTLWNPGARDAVLFTDLNTSDAGFVAAVNITVRGQVFASGSPGVALLACSVHSELEGVVTNDDNTSLTMRHCDVETLQTAVAASGDLCMEGCVVSSGDTHAAVECNAFGDHEPNTCVRSCIVRGGSLGIDVAQGNLMIKDCVVSGASQDGIVVRRTGETNIVSCTVADCGRSGIVSKYGRSRRGQFVVRDCAVLRNARNGVRVSSVNDSMYRIEGCSISHNVRNAVLVTSVNNVVVSACSIAAGERGINVLENSKVRVFDTNITGTTQAVVTDRSSVSLFRCHVVAAITGGTAQDNAWLNVEGTVFSSCEAGISVGGYQARSVLKQCEFTGVNTGVRCVNGIVCMSDITVQCERAALLTDHATVTAQRVTVSGSNTASGFNIDQYSRATLMGCVVRGIGFGVDVNHYSTANVVDTTIEDTMHGIVVTDATADATSSSVRRTTGAGVLLGDGAQATLADCSVECDIAFQSKATATLETIGCGFEN